MATLYELNEQIVDLTEKLIDPETGEVNEEILEQLDKLNMDRDTKLEGCGLMLKELMSQIVAIKAEIDALKKRLTSKTNRFDNLMRYVDNNLGGEKFETSKVAFSYRKSESVSIVNEAIIPDQLCKFETKRTPIKTDIKKLLKAGREIPGCVLEEHNNLNIR